MGGLQQAVVTPPKTLGSITKPHVTLWSRRVVPAYTSQSWTLRDPFPLDPAACCQPAPPIPCHTWALLLRTGPGLQRPGSAGKLPSSCVSLIRFKKMFPSHSAAGMHADPTCLLPGRFQPQLVLGVIEMFPFPFVIVNNLWEQNVRLSKPIGFSSQFTLS